MISSNLLKESASDSSKFFILFGFCLIASLSSKAFIQKISDRLLKEIKNTKEKLADIKKDVEPIISKETEAQETEGRGFFLNARGFSFDENVKKLLNSLGSSKYAWRTLAGMSQETGLATPTVLKSLNWLLSNSLAVKTNEKGRTLWGLTLEGRDMLAEMSSSEKSKQKEKE
jgi:ribosomal protein L17